MFQYVGKRFPKPGQYYIKASQNDPVLCDSCHGSKQHIIVKPIEVYFAVVQFPKATIAINPSLTLGGLLIEINKVNNLGAGLGPNDINIYCRNFVTELSRLVPKDTYSVEPKVERVWRQPTEVLADLVGGEPSVP